MTWRRKSSPSACVNRPRACVRRPVRASSAAASRVTSPRARNRRSPTPAARPHVTAKHMARALDRVADRLGAATGNEDRDSRRLVGPAGSDAGAARPDGQPRALDRGVTDARHSRLRTTRGRREGSAGREAASDSAGRPARVRSRRRAASRAKAGSSRSAQAREGSAGQQGGSSGGNGGRLQQLQRDVNEQDARGRTARR